MKLVKKLMGKPPMNPMVFYSGKIAGYVVWIYFMLTLSGLSDIKSHNIEWINILSYFLLIVSVIIISISLFDLGMSTRFGLPTDETVLKTRGIYRFSRNPMYLGFYLLTIGGMIYIGKWWIILLGVYSIIVYHQIILNEERFLGERFGENYSEFKKRVRRYF